MKILVFQHICVEHPGSFRAFMAEDAIAWDAIELDEGEAIPSLDHYDALMVMGGPMDVWQEREHPWLVTEKSAIREAVLDRKLPYLGFCLGHQLLADALGGHVAPMATPEVGVLEVELTEAAAEDPLFDAMPTPCNALQWHSAEVVQTPPGSAVLGTSPVCAVQAFRTGAKAYGIQYHTELTAQTVPEWGCVPEYEQALEETLGTGALDKMRTQVDELLPGINANARILYDNFMAIVRARTAP